MRWETTSSSGYNSLADRSGKAKEGRQQEQTHAYNEQQLPLDVFMKGKIVRFKGADNPYAAALADVFGLEA